MRALLTIVALAAVAFDPATGLAQAPTPAPSEPAAQASQPAAPKPAPPSVAGRVLTLDEAIAIALDTQPNIQARLSDYAAAQFRVDQALSPLLPQLTGTWNAARAQNVTGSPGTSLGTAVTRTRTFWTDTTLARVTGSQLLFDFGKTLAATDVARRNADVSLEDVELQRQLITLAVKEAYTNINFAQRLIKVNQQALERADLNLRSARGFFEVGTRPKSDVTRAEVDVANARLGVIQARNAERVARVALNVAMGIAADTPTQVQDNLQYQQVGFERPQLLAEALRQRPEYKQEKLKVDAAQAFVRQTLRNFFPDITAGGFYGAQRADMNEVWELNVGLTWSIFDGGNRVARYREARAAYDAAQARVKAKELDISREVEQTQLSLAETEERIQAAQAAVASAQENFRLAQGRFDAGVGTILELTDAQLALTQAQNTEAQALADYRIAIARLERALGRR
ncbi:MAG: TolC family protein [Candidatus Rokubacteria bacterium]|nr:TolC family protein [Candidatus Rokubacteria bacterium]